MRLLTDPNDKALCIFMILVFFFSAFVEASPIPKIERAIEHIMKDAPGRELARKPELRRELARDIQAASEARGVPALLILAVAAKESSLKTHAKGELNEIGIMQVHGLAAKGCDLETQRGQIDCGARYLAKTKRKCGTWTRAFCAYASGSCYPRTKRTAWVVKNRIRFWERLEAL